MSVGPWLRRSLSPHTSSFSFPPSAEEFCYGRNGKSNIDCFSGPLLRPVIVPDVVAIAFHAGCLVAAATVVEADIVADAGEGTSADDALVLNLHHPLLRFHIYLFHSLRPTPNPSRDGGVAALERAYRVILLLLRPTPDPSRDGGERLALWRVYRVIDVIVSILFLSAGPLHPGRGAHRAGWVFRFLSSLSATLRRWKTARGGR